MRPNVLFVTLDQFRGDALSCAGHPLVRTPNLDALAAEGVRFARHYSQAAPCAPGRAALYTGTYQMNNRVVANGTPLDDRFDNIARAAARAGYHPVTFGYTDTGIDPRQIDDPADPRLSTYESVLPGFEEELELDERQRPWLAWLRELGYTGPETLDPDLALATEHTRPAEHSVSTFLADHVLTWMAEQHEPWFAHVSFIRPHPPYDAAGEYATMYDPADCPPPLPIPAELHPLHRTMLGVPVACAPTDPAELAHMQAQYFGMISEVDHHVGRLVAALRASGEWDNTVIVITSDHGEQLGDQGMQQKLGWFESSYHILTIVRDPRHPDAHGTVVQHFTENVDLMPTVCEAIGLPVPLQCDGVALTPFLRGELPPRWRDAVHYEWDWRDVYIAHGSVDAPADRRLERLNLAVLRTGSHAYVQFADASWLCYDLAADPTWQTRTTDPAVVLPLAQAMLVWRQTNFERQLSGVLLRDGGIGRMPDPAPA